MAAGEKNPMGGNQGHGGVLELGKLGTRVPEFSRDGRSNPPADWWVVWWA